MVLIFILVSCLAACIAGEAEAATEMTTIKLNGDSISLNGAGATVDGNTLTITSAGTYTISGVLNNGQIKVDTQDAETVKLVLDGMDISSSSRSPIYIANAEKTVIALAAGTKNTVTDGSSYSTPDTGSGEPDAAIFSKDDLTINGDGTLTVNANYNDGISSNDDLKITGGSITVNAVNDGIKGRDSVVVKGGSTTIRADGDGIQSSNDEDSTKGYVSIEDGIISLVTEADGIQAETSLTISGGQVTITSGGGSSSGGGSTKNQWGSPGVTSNVASTETASAKGLKAGVALTITGGTIRIDSSDDSIHSDGSVAISGGTVDAASGDDAIHAESTVRITGGDIRITKSYEGIEGADITIDDGTIHLVATDDGINAASGSGVTQTSGKQAGGQPGPGQPGQGTFETSGNNTLHINGGYIVVNAGGDGLDINGPITMTGGVVLVNGPTNDGNGAIDYTGSFKITGGRLIAAGSSGMAMAPDTSSTQYSVMVTYPSTQQAGTMAHVQTKHGEDILTFVPAKSFQSVVFSLPELAPGTDYIVYSGGSSTGTATDGLYSGGTYTPGTQVTNFTISTMVTNAGSRAANSPGAMRGNTTNGIPGDRTGGMPNQMNGTPFGGLTGRTTSSMLGNFASSITSGTKTGFLGNLTRSETTWMQNRILSNGTGGHVTQMKTSIPLVGTGTPRVQAVTVTRWKTNGLPYTIV